MRLCRFIPDAAGGLSQISISSSFEEPHARSCCVMRARRRTKDSVSSPSPLPGCPLFQTRSRGSLAVLVLTGRRCWVQLPAPQRSDTGYTGQLPAGSVIVRLRQEAPCCSTLVLHTFEFASLILGRFCCQEINLLNSSVWFKGDWKSSRLLARLRSGSERVCGGGCV